MKNKFRNAGLLALVFLSAMTLVTGYVVANNIMVAAGGSCLIAAILLNIYLFHKVNCSET